MFNNTQEFEINELTYEGNLESNIKQSKISNQGGLIVFRCANNKISKYSSFTNNIFKYIMKEN